MNVNETSKISDPEPDYEKEMIELKEKEELDELILGLVEYARNLELQVVELRSKVNWQTPVVLEKPFPDLHGDLYETFDHYASYPKFKEILKILE